MGKGMTPSGVDKKLWGKHYMNGLKQSENARLDIFQIQREEDEGFIVLKGL